MALYGSLTRPAMIAFKRLVGLIRKLLLIVKRCDQYIMRSIIGDYRSHGTLSSVDLISEATGAALALAELAEDAKRFARAAKARATIDAYASDVADFERFCALHGLGALPAEPQTVGRYVSALATTGSAIPRLRREPGGTTIIDIRPAAVSTIRRRLVAIAQQHRLLGHEAPTENAIVREILKGRARTRHGAPEEDRVHLRSP